MACYVVHTRPCFTNTLKSLLTLIIMCLVSSAVFAAEGNIDEIRFSGNKVTRESVMRQEMLVKEGDPLNPVKIEHSRQAIMNLGLFKQVKSEILQEESANVLLITVEERFYILPLPLLDARLEEEELSYGIELRHDNLLGLNQRLKLTYEHKKSADGEIPTRKESGLNYAYPRILGSSQNLAITGNILREEKHELENDTVIGRYRLDTRGLAFRVSRWLGPDAISRGWLLGGGMGVIQQIYSRQHGTAETYNDSQALDLNGGLGYSAIEEYPYRREGAAYGAGLSVSLPDMGSDYSYNRLTLYHRNYHTLDLIDASLHTQIKLGVANGSSFGNPAFSVGGGDSLRGYESDFVRGNALLQLNAEYHHHLSGYRQLRGVVFVDAGNSWPGGTEMDGKLYPSTGLGLRWRVQSFVDLTLRIDAAYAVDTQETKLYASTRSSF